MGLADGVVNMAPYNEGLSADHLATIAKAEADVSSGAINPFAGPISDQSGAERVAACAVLPDPDARGMDWFVAGMYRHRKITTMTPRLELRGITKAYPGVIANADVSLSVAPGEIHAIRVKTVQAKAR